MDAPRVLVVVTDETLKVLLGDLLQAEGYQVEVAAGREPALDALQRRLPALVLLHMDASGVDSYDLVAQVRAYGRRVPIVILGPRDDAAALAGLLQADGWLPMPFDLDELYAVLARLTRPPAEP